MSPAGMYEAIVKGDATLEPGVPESFHVLIKETARALGLDVELLEKEQGGVLTEDIYAIFQRPRTRLILRL